MTMAYYIPPSQETIESRLAQKQTDKGIIAYCERKLGRSGLRLVTWTDRAGVARKGMPLSSADMHRAAETRQSWLKFMEAVEIELEDKPATGGMIPVARTGGIYSKLGLPRKPFIYSRQHLRAALAPCDTTIDGYNGHGLTKQDLYHLPELLERPVALLNSPDHPDSMVAVLNRTDSRGRVLIAAIKVSPTHRMGDRIGEANIVASYYGKNDAYFTRKTAGELVISREVIYQDLAAGRELDALTGREGFFGKPLANGLVDKQVFRKPQCIKNLEENRALTNKEAAHEAPCEREEKTEGACRHANLVAASRAAAAINSQKKNDETGPGNEER